MVVITIFVNFITMNTIRLSTGVSTDTESETLDIDTIECTMLPEKSPLI